MEITDRIKQNLTRHPEIPVLIGLLALYMFLSNFFAWSLAFQQSYLNVSGGSDPYFNYYLVQYILNTHTQLTHTILLNYPAGTVNPRPPFYQWSIVFAGYILSPFMGLKMGAYYAFQESDAFYGALLIIPVYLITKQIFGKKAGLFAAVLFTIMPGNLTSGILTDGRAHTPELIFAFLSIYFFEMAVISAKKGVIISKLTDTRSYFTSIKKYYEENKIATIYILMAAVSLGGLIVFWQGFPYIEVILLIYVAVQLIYNLIVKKPTGYLTYLTAIYVAASFPIGFYYYDVTFMLHTWFIPPLVMGLMIVGFGILVNIVARRPWIITIPSMVIVIVAALFVLSKTNPAILKELITGDGYFVKSRVYSTIAEAAAPPLGQYISDFGPGLFLLGIAGVPFIIYRFLKEKKEAILLVIIFAIFSIFMSFEAARFNITAAPVYAILGGGLIMYFADIIRHNEATKKSKHVSGRKSLHKNISGVTVGFAIIVILILIIPSGMGAFSASVPENSAASYDHILNSTLPKGLRPDNPFGNYGLAIDNKTQPLAASFEWLATQNANESIQDRPAYVSWWDYGFQELEQGRHPTVADDFQQGIASAGQILLAQNQTQRISLFISRVLQTPGGYSDGHFNATITAVMDKYFGINETNTLTGMYGNPLASRYLPLLNETAYGSHQINVTTSGNAMHALIMGQLSTKYNVSILVSAYTGLEKVTGSSLSYIQIDHALFPFSGNNPGIFYAPAYLTDTASYTADGEVVPINYYNVIATTSTGATYPLNKLPAGATVTSYSLSYTPTFYNTTIYNTVVGIPPQYLSELEGGRISVSPAFNMSNFELVYYASEYNPTKNATSTTPGWTLIPIQTAYTYQKEGKGTEVLLPANLIGEEDPIIQYYPGAVITGRVTSATGAGVAGVHITIDDQYGIPHEIVTTNSAGYYTITGLPGNDTLVYSTGSVNSLSMEGTNIIGTNSVNVSTNQGERIGNYNITENMILHRNTVYGNVILDNITSSNAVNSGTIILDNSTYGITRNVTITNGIYSVSNVIPYNYNVTVKTDGNIYKNFTTIDVSYKTQQHYNLTIKMDQIKVTASVDSLALSGYTVYVNQTEGNYTFKAITPSNGTVSISVFPGTYIVTIKSNGSEDKNSVTLSGWNNTKSITLTPELTANVSGKAAPGAKVWVYFNGIISDALNVTANSTGYYHINMPYGVYTIYSNDSGKAFVQTLNVTGNVVMNINYHQAHYYNIRSTMKGTKDYSGHYEILATNSSAFLYSVYSNSSNVYRIYLPIGNYSISGTGTFNSTTLSGFNVSNPDTSYNITLNLDIKAPYNITASTNNSLRYATEGILIVYNGTVPYYYSELNSGIATLYGYNTSTVRIESPYYYNNTNNNINEQIYNVSQKLVSVNISIYNDSSRDYNGNISLIGSYNTYTLKMTNNTAIGEVAEGIYYTQVSSKSAYIVPVITGTVVNNSNSQIFMKNTDLYFSLINSNKTIERPVTYLINSTGIPVRLSHIPAGTYTLYSYNETNEVNGTIVNLSRITITQNTTVDIVYVKGYKIDITNNLNIPASYRIKNGTEEIETAQSSNTTMVLPSSNYTITSSGNFINSTGAYSYVNAKGQYINVTVSAGNTTFKIGLVPTEIKDKLSGNVVYYSNSTAISGRVHIDITRDGKTVESTNSTSSGNYSVSGLNPGTYGIYANYTYSGNHYAYFENATLNAFSNKTFNIFMMPAFSVTLKGYNSKDVPTNLTIIDSSMYITTSEITHTIFLPANSTYEFTLINSTSQNGIWFNYSKSVSLYLNKSITETLTLKLVPLYKYVLTDPSVTGYVGEKVTTNVTIQNKGNINNTIYLYSGKSIWNLNFSENNFTIPVNTTKSVSIVIEIPAVPAGNNTIPIWIKVNNTNFAQSIGNITVDVLKGAGYNFTYSNYAAVNGTINMIPITIKNTNSTSLNIFMSISNSAHLKSVDDISAYLTYNGKNLTNITLNPGESIIVYIYANGIHGRILHSVPIDVDTNTTTSIGEIYDNKTITPVLPSATIGTGSSGTTIINDYTANPDITIYIGIGIIVAALLAGIIGSSIRSRKKR